MRVHSNVRAAAFRRGSTLEQRPSHAWHTGLWERRVTRRDAVAAGTAALGALAVPRIALGAPPTAGPKPIPGVLAPDAPIHLMLPGYPPLGSPDPATNDPITITDFNGHLGLAYVQGMGTRTNKATGSTARLPFEVDLRFMKGEFVATDGRRRHGAFALI